MRILKKSHFKKKMVKYKFKCVNSNVYHLLLLLVVNWYDAKEKFPQAMYLFI